MKEKRSEKEKKSDEFEDKAKHFEINGKKEPWGIYFKAIPDLNHMFALGDLPVETFEPPPTPKGKLREQINFLTIEL